MIRVSREIVMKRLVAVIAILVLCSNVYGTLVDLDNAPSWRGDVGSTYQAWSFSDATLPDVVQNDYGTPTLSVSNNSITTTHMPGYGARPGVWKVMLNDKMYIDIPNTDNTDPDSWKEIRLQIIYSDPGGDGSPVPILTDPVWEWGNLTRVGHEDLLDGYILDTYDIIFEPNPTEERIELMAIQYNIYISAIGIDTICIPEPATMCLLALGGLGLLRKRRA